MSNIIPPLLSNTPPPPPSPEDDDDDEFGDFTGANDLSYGCDNLSLPPSPDHSPKKASISNGLDINSNTEKNNVVQVNLGVEKDFQDKRKDSESFNHVCTLQEKCVESTEDNIFQYSVSTVTDTTCVQKISEDTFELDLKNDSNFHIDDEVEIKGDIESETELCSNLRTADCISNTDSEKSQQISLTEVKENQNSPNFPIDNSIDEDIYTLTKNLENKMNLESKIAQDDTVEDERHPCGSDSKTISEELPENKEFNDVVHTDVSPPQEIENLCEEHKEVNEIGPEHFINQSTFEHENTDDKTTEEQNYSDEEFADFAFAEDAGKTSIETTHCDTNEITEELHSSLNKITPPENIVKEANTVLNPSTDVSNVGTIAPNNITETKVQDAAIEYDFDDFCEFASNTLIQDNKEDQLQSPNEEDFGNFANFPVAEEPVYLLLNEKEALEKSISILKEMFPSCSNTEEDFQYTNVESSDFIFNELKDVTETNALTYLWSKSASQNMLLKALNIDARNILYGASWNPSMPRFAANLGLTPLEPIKTEMPPCTLKSSPSTSSQPSSDIPSAQFDWNGSGLVNPLDYSQTMLLDLEQLVASLDIPTCNTSSNSNRSSSPAELNDWDIWLQSISKDPVETNTTEKPSELPVEQTILQPQVVAKPVTSHKVPSKNDLEEVVSQEQSSDDFEDFTSYQSSTGGSETWPNIVPLRETYISSDAKDLPLDISNWLQPTIVTPELPRKSLEMADEELPNIQTPEFTRKEVALEEEDEFDDFQMVLPDNSDQKSNTEIKNCLQPAATKSNASNIDFTNFDFPEEKPKTEPVNLFNNLNQIKTNLETNKMEEKEPVTVDDDDDFTEFHSSVPAPQPIVPKPLTPILEPLKPVPVYAAQATPTQINWPDPGITDEEIKKFEMMFKPPQGGKKEEPKERTSNASKDSSFDDEEWSDFVSVQKPSPVHKFQSSEKERTSSPDLPLSVLNLGNIQPTKQPIPVITPHGLIQTKLSSNSSHSSPKTQLKNTSMHTQHRAVYSKQMQPSIISNQFASQVSNFNNGMTNQNKAILNFPNPPQNASNSQSLDDDDWSDFISSPLPPTTSNGYQQNSSYKQSNWTTSSSPNIIANPRHFFQSGSDTRNKRVSSLSVSSKKSTIPSISLPELEFVAPKERTSNSRKK